MYFFIKLIKKFISLFQARACIKCGGKMFVIKWPESYEASCTDDYLYGDFRPYMGCFSISAKTRRKAIILWNAMNTLKS